jgi:hypothetical protein
VRDNSPGAADGGIELGLRILIARFIAGGYIEFCRLDKTKYRKIEQMNLCLRKPGNFLERRFVLRKRKEVALRVFLGLLLLCACLLSTSCQANALDIPPSPMEEPVSAIPRAGDPQMTPSLPANAGLQQLIDQAVADLASRLSVPVVEITVLEAAPVVWPDASLGCPEKGMAYAQVLIPGYLIVLEHGTMRYEYHSSLKGPVNYCQNPTPPVPGTPGNT